MNNKSLISPIPQDAEAQDIETPEDIHSEQSDRIQGFIRNQSLRMSWHTVIHSISLGRHMAARLTRMRWAGYASIWDSARCRECGGLDGTVLRVDSYEYNAFSPPRHNFCRCFWIYAKDASDEILKDLAGENASRNNPLSFLSNYSPASKLYQIIKKSSKEIRDYDKERNDFLRDLVTFLEVIPKQRGGRSR